MKQALQKLLAPASVALLLAGIAAPASLAATTPAPAAGSGQALEIAPPLTYLKVNPGQTVTSKILIRDVAKTDLIITGQANDFVAEGETGTPKVILDNNTPDPYSMKDWVAPIASLTLKPQQIQTMTITLNVPANASPGGHYGVIRFTGTPPSLNGQGVSLSASVGSLFLVTVSGKITDQLSVTEFSVNKAGKTGHLFQSGPLNFVERINNTGNVHEEPTGLVTITDMFGRKLATLPINQSQNNILPASIRKFNEDLNSSVIGNKHLFGHYTAKLSLTYGASQKTVNASLSFWVIPYKLVAIVIAAIIILFFALRYGIKRYNRYVLERANRNQRPPQAPQPPHHPHQQ